MKKLRLRKRQKKLILAGIAGAAILGFFVLEYGYFSRQLAYVFGLDRPVVPPTADETHATPPLVTPDRLWIPAIGLAEVPIIDVTERTEAAYQKAVQDGVGHFPGTAEIGRPGNAYLFGHSSDYAWSKGSYKTVFALLPKLVPGDEVVASDRAGVAYRYHITETFVVAPDDLSVLDQFGNQKSLLTLQTSYPLGTALKRYIVRAELEAQ